ncbi:hypothetical protein ACRAWF_20670 [Streptomyces sp. L7]
MTTTRVPRTPRIPPLPPAEWPPVLRALLADSHRDGPGRENLFGTLAHHPVLAHAWLSLARVLTPRGHPRPPQTRAESSCASPTGSTRPTSTVGTAPRPRTPD